MCMKVFIFLSFFLLVSCSTNKEIIQNKTSDNYSEYTNNTKDDVEEYQEAVSHFQTITIDSLEEKRQSQQEFYLFIGTETCPYCRIFAPKLAQSAETSNKTIFYLDSSANKNIQDYLISKNISTIPKIYFFDRNNNRKTIEDLDSESITTDEIINFLENP